MVSTRAVFSALLAAGAAAAQAASNGPTQAADFAALRAWLQDYRNGVIRIVREDRPDEQAIAAAEELMARVARDNSLAAAQLLFAVAVVEPVPPGATAATERVDLQRELQPWRVRTMAQNHLRAMTGPGVLPWLLGMLKAPGLRAAKANDDQRNAVAVLRILGGHPGVEARLELLVACRSLPAELRVQAVNALACDATLELAPVLLELLRDAEPNVRIAAANALGTALQPHTDETQAPVPAAGVAALRDQALAKLEELLVRDRIWQVRSAAAFAIASLKCKAAVPALIRGLDAELKRQKDPWAMDVRLHKLLEGLTGQSVVRGSIAPWQEFWAKEGPTFAYRPAAAAIQPSPAAGRYQRFFDLEIESDRVLFVVDFSGSMAEPVTLSGQGTAARAGAPTTKAELVVQEVKRLVLGMPDGALLNFVVFSDEVRIWRGEGRRPALVRLDDAARDDLLGSFLDALRPGGPTNLYDALATALGFGGRGLHDKYYEAGFDTLYVITDGAPTAGPIVDKDEIRRRVREVNQLRRITIHCVTFGDQNDTDFLRPLAEENGGRHIHID